MMINYRYYKNHSVLKTLIKYTKLILSKFINPHQLKLLNHAGELKYQTIPYASVEMLNQICQECRICEGVCPTQSIEINQSWQLKQDTCITCARCIEVCPQQYLKPVNNHKTL
jgi:Fe-S-cluster-containing hydrogenase component 2